MVDPDPTRGVYGISVAAELSGMGVQNLRLYEARGLLEPDRTAGGTRRYSADDLERLRRIGELLDAGLNLAGIALVLDLQDSNAELRAELGAVGVASPEPGVDPSANRNRVTSPADHLVATVKAPQRNPGAERRQS